MAKTTLRMAFETGTGRKLYIATDYVKPTITAIEVSGYMDALIAEPGFFVIPPTAKVGAELITREDVAL